VADPVAFITKLLDSPEEMKSAGSIAGVMLEANQEKIVWNPMLDSINKHCSAQRGTIYVLQLLANQNEIENDIKISAESFFGGHLHINVNFVLNKSLFVLDEPVLELTVILFIETEPVDTMVALTEFLKPPKKKFWWFQKSNPAGWEFLYL